MAPKGRVKMCRFFCLFFFNGRSWSQGQNTLARPNTRLAFPPLHTLPLNNNLQAWVSIWGVKINSWVIIPLVLAAGNPEVGLTQVSCSFTGFETITGVVCVRSGWFSQPRSLAAAAPTTTKSTSCPPRPNLHLRLHLHPTQS